MAKITPTTCLTFQLGASSLVVYRSLWLRRLGSRQLPTFIRKPTSIRPLVASTYDNFPLSRPHSFPDRRHRMVVCTISALLQFICTLIMADNKERTFLMIKPDGVQRGLIGKIIQRFEQKGFKLVAMKMVWPTEELLKKHYADLASRPFFPGLVQYMSSGAVVPMVWEGLNIVKTGRTMLGETNPKDSAPGTIRGDFCIAVGRNIIHGSDSVESAKKEIDLWFSEKEIIDYTPASEKWIYE